MGLFKQFKEVAQQKAMELVENNKEAAQQKALEFLQNNPEKAQTLLETAGKVQEALADKKAGNPVDYQAVATDVAQNLKKLFKGPQQ